MDKIETLPPPPGVVGSLRAGFDAIASNLSVILLPLALDLFLWLGPRLRVDQLFRPLFEEMSRYARFSGLSSSDVNVLQENTSQFLAQLQQYNLLTTLRTFPIGVFSLLSGRISNQTPLGSSLVIQVDSLITLSGWIIFLTLVGWVSGALFFRWVSLVVVDPPLSVQFYLSKSILQTILLSVLSIMLAIMIGTPLVVVIALVITASPLLAQGLLLALGLLSMWLIVPVFFTPHGIFMHQQNAITSISTSLRMARFTLPTSSLFVLSVLLIAYGLNFLWNIPSPDSWMTLVGIAGHAFITTSLLAASFIYYRDMQVWLQTVLDRLKANIPAKKA
ncbi:MAG: hypothetical protein JW963_00490 [Anaerolineales bacterium]|nr:hypothetical protein [Anaerolineales bacterium]